MIAKHQAFAALVVAIFISLLLAIIYIWQQEEQEVTVNAWLPEHHLLINRISDDESGAQYHRLCIWGSAKTPYHNVSLQVYRHMIGKSRGLVFISDSKVMYYLIPPNGGAIFRATVSYQEKAAPLQINENGENNYNICIPPNHVVVNKKVTDGLRNQLSFFEEYFYDSSEEVDFAEYQQWFKEGFHFVLFGRGKVKYYTVSPFGGKLFYTEKGYVPETGRMFCYFLGFDKTGKIGFRIETSWLLVFSYFVLLFFVFWIFFAILSWMSNNRQREWAQLRAKNEAWHEKQEAEERTKQERYRLEKRRVAPLGRIPKTEPEEKPKKSKRSGSSKKKTSTSGS